MPLNDSLILFFVGMIGTIAFIRLYLLFFPQTNLYVFGRNVHHLYLGALMLLVLNVINIAGLKGWEFVALSGIGSALVVDQLVYLVASSGGHRAYFSALSFFGMVLVVAILVFVGFLTSLS